MFPHSTVSVSVVVLFLRARYLPSHDTDHPMLSEWGCTRPSKFAILRGMSERARQTPVRQDLERAVEYLKSVGCSEIFVFGSTARGDYRDDSDLDIAVRGIPADQFFAVYGELMTRLSRPVDLVDLDLQKRFGKQLLEGSDMRRVA